MSESTKAEEWRIERAKRMNSNASAPQFSLDTALLNQKLKDADFGEQEIHVIQILISQSWRTADRAASADIFTDALASQIDAIRRAAFDEAIAIVGQHGQCLSDEKHRGYSCICVMQIDFRAARDATPADEEPKTRSDKGKHHHVAGVLQEDVDEAEN